VLEARALVDLYGPFGVDHPAHLDPAPCDHLSDRRQVELRGGQPPRPGRLGAEGDAEAGVDVALVRRSAELPVDALLVEGHREPPLREPVVTPAHLLHVQHVHDVVPGLPARIVEAELALHVHEGEVEAGERVALPRHLQLRREMKRGQLVERDVVGLGPERDR